ncbi:fidgetin-like protein 1 [Plakobranchus ocellatus]|uniref:Fidgetin-like protein 1 n=1 Tax=Plakobranchus ocellatus TaxID=259542 RepID=A0AAV4B4J1_9GAST|nr:fidgetin-like protein 1 [Plakobranchus ocellatus]
MSSSTANGAFLSRHQMLHFSCQQLEGKKNPSKLADDLRNLYLHHSDSGTALLGTADEYLRDYADVVDNMDSGGLNNFAEGALALCQFYKNDSCKWETYLTEEKIMQLPCFMAAMEGMNPHDYELVSDSEDCDINLGSHSTSFSNIATASDFTISDNAFIERAPQAGLRNSPANSGPKNNFNLARTDMLAAVKPKVGMFSTQSPGPPEPSQVRKNSSINEPFPSPAPSLPQNQLSSKLKRSLYQETLSNADSSVSIQKAKGKCSEQLPITEFVSLFQVVSETKKAHSGSKREHHQSFVKLDHLLQLQKKNKRFSLPEHWMCNNSPHFTSDEFKLFIRGSGIKYPWSSISPSNEGSC